MVISEVKGEKWAACWVDGYIDPEVDERAITRIFADASQDLETILNSPHPVRLGIASRLPQDSQKPIFEDFFVLSPDNERHHTDYPAHSVGFYKELYADRNPNYCSVIGIYPRDAPGRETMKELLEDYCLTVRPDARYENADEFARASQHLLGLVLKAYEEPRITALTTLSERGLNLH